MAGKALIYGTNYVDGKPTKFVPFYWENDDWQHFSPARDCKTAAGCERFLKKYNFTDIKYDIKMSPFAAFPSE
jgi:hypothetical protein